MTMKEQIQKIREYREGFTLAELLIVVAIIMVLVAIAIPVFTSSLHSSQAATDEANCRSLYAELQADYLSNMTDSYYTSDSASSLTAAKSGATYDGTNIIYSDGEKVDLADQNGDETITVKFTPGKGWGVTFACTGCNISTSWGVN